MKRSRKDIQEKKYRKILKTHSNRHREDNDPKNYKREGFRRCWEVSTRFKKHYLYKELKEIFHLVSDDVQYKGGHIFQDEWPNSFPSFKGIYAKDFRALSPMQQMCFRKDNVPDEKAPWNISAWERKRGLIYNEKYFLKEELKGLLYLKVEPNYRRLWWNDYQQNSEYKREENFIVNHEIRQKGSKVCGWSYKFHDYWDYQPENKDKELIKQFKKDVEEVW